MDDRARLGDAALLAVLLALLLAWPLVAPPIGQHGEAREGLVVQDIVAHGNWILPRRNGELPSKPPLFHWSAALAVRWLGAHDASIRLPSAAAALVVVLAVYWLGVAIGGRRVGWLASGIAMGMVPFLDAATQARVDMVFTAAITVALAGFAVWERRGSRLGQTLCYLGGATAVLAKGPAGAIIPALVIVAYLAVERRLATLRALWSWPLAAAASALAVGWYVLAALDGGAAILRLQLVHENLERIVGHSSFHHSGHHNRARLPLALFGGLLPWSLALLWSAVARVRGRPFDASDRFLHTWWLVVLALFTASAGQRPVYLLPAVPAVALIAARLVAGVVDDWPAWLRVPTRLRTPIAAVALALAVFDLGALAALQAVRYRRADERSLAAFGTAVARLVPSDAPLLATATLGREETLTLAYRTTRPIARAADEVPRGAYYLAPAAEAASRSQRGDRVVAESQRRRGGNVALLKAAP